MMVEGKEISLQVVNNNGYRLILLPVSSKVKLSEFVA